MVTAELAPARARSGEGSAAVGASHLAPAMVDGQYPLVPGSLSRAGSVLSGALLLRGVAQRFAHPDGGSVVRVALTVTNAGPATFTVVPAAFALGASRPWPAGQRFSESAVAPGASVAGVLAFRSSAAPKAGPDEVALSYLDAVGGPGAQLRITAAPVAVPAATVRALEGLVVAQARFESPTPSSATPRVASELAVTVDHAMVLPSSAYERRPRLGVTLSVVNLTPTPQTFVPASVQLLADAVPPGAPVVSGPSEAQVTVAPMTASALTVTWALPADPTQDFDVRFTYGPAGKFLLDEVRRVTVLSPATSVASGATAGSAAPALAPGKRTVGTVAPNAPADRAAVVFASSSALGALGTAVTGAGP